jgi:hypothetical protein
LFPPHLRPAGTEAVAQIIPARGLLALLVSRDHRENRECPAHRGLLVPTAQMEHRALRGLLARRGHRVPQARLARRESRGHRERPLRSVL